jgi:hypothetical protein
MDTDVVFQGKRAPLNVHVREVGVVSPAAVRKRLRSGMSLEDALTTPPMSTADRIAKSFAKPKTYKRAQIHTISGFTGNLRELSERFGVDYAVALKRLGKYGWSAEDTFLTPVRKQRRG